MKTIQDLAHWIIDGIAMGVDEEVGSSDRDSVNGVDVVIERTEEEDGGEVAFNIYVDNSFAPFTQFGKNITYEEVLRDLLENNIELEIGETEYLLNFSYRGLKYYIPITEVQILRDFILNDFFYGEISYEGEPKTIALGDDGQLNVSIFPYGDSLCCEDCQKVKLIEVGEYW